MVLGIFTPKVHTEIKMRMAPGPASYSSNANIGKVGWFPEVIKTTIAIALTNNAREYTAAD